MAPKDSHCLSPYPPPNPRLFFLPCIIALFHWLTFGLHYHSTCDSINLATLLLQLNLFDNGTCFIRREEWFTPKPWLFSSLSFYYKKTHTHTYICVCYYTRFMTYDKQTDKVMVYTPVALQTCTYCSTVPYLFVIILKNNNS